ncbi:hypothetical protein AAS21_gp203 [Pantoea phage vB_PagS_AAS21]|uniref:Uncharacterized protein n=1 Tax=Pantoea phage vB_PagS_AAS21 TaxID=2575261 RepID=A0A4Y5P1U9_9CAUD|nr:hypothetical protein AAS21_gp203 [Pantoea phage vB_PagS_AAS21]
MIQCLTHSLMILSRHTMCRLSVNC